MISSLFSVLTIKPAWLTRGRSLMLAIAVGSVIGSTTQGTSQTLPLAENLTAYDTPQGEQL